MASTVQERDPANAAREKRAVAKEDLVFLTSDAKEKVDKTLAGMKGAGHILTHPFSKEAREEANARTADEKDKVAAKQQEVRAVAHRQKEFEVAAAAAADLGQQQQGNQGEQPAIPSPLPATNLGQEQQRNQGEQSSLPAPSPVVDLGQQHPRNPGEQEERTGEVPFPTTASAGMGLPPVTPSQSSFERFKESSFSSAGEGISPATPSQGSFEGFWGPSISRSSSGSDGSSVKARADAPPATIDGQHSREASISRSLMSDGSSARSQVAPTAAEEDFREGSLSRSPSNSDGSCKARAEMPPTSADYRSG